MTRFSGPGRDIGASFSQVPSEFLRMLDEFRQSAASWANTTATRVRSEVTPTADEESNEPPPAWIPSVDVLEHDQEYQVVFDVPGVDPARIDLSVQGRELVVRGVRTVALSPGCSSIRSERPSGVFSRKLSFSGEILAESVIAEYQTGVLTVRLPKTETTRSRVIPIRTTEQSSNPVSPAPDSTTPSM